MDISTFFQFDFPPRTSDGGFFPLTGCGLCMRDQAGGKGAVAGGAGRGFAWAGWGPARVKEGWSKVGLRARA